MPLKEYVEKNRTRGYAEGSKVEATENPVEPQTPIVSRETSQTAQTGQKKTASPLTALSGDPKTAAQRDARMREFYNKQLADARNQQGSFGELTGIDAVLRKYGSLSPTGERITETGLQEAYKARKGAEAAATAGIAELDAQKAALNTRQAVIDAFKAGDLNLASSLDPALTKELITNQYLPAKTQSEIVKNTAPIVTAANKTNAPVSPHGKQALDEGYVPGTPEYQKRTNEIARGVGKPLTGTPAKQQEAFGEQFNNANRNIQEGTRLLGILEKEPHVATFNPIAFLSRTFGVGTAAEVETILSALAPKQRPPGAGATSDYDAKQYKKAVGGGLSAANMKKQVEVGLAFSKHDADYASFMSKVLEYRGSQSEAQKLWQEYAKDQPIFDQKTGKLRAGRKSFEQWTQDKGIDVDVRIEPKTVSSGANAAASATAPAAAAPAAAPAANKPSAGGMLPPQAASQLKEGTQTTFGNGQVWTLQNGKPVRIS